MKIKRDFVTNSSSTSYILSMEHFTEKEFMEKIGVTIDFPLKYIFEQLYHALEDEKRELVDYVNVYGEGKTVEEFLRKKGYGQDTIQKVHELISADKSVYYGELHSDYEAEVSFFCCDSFIYSDDNFYINGEIGIW